MVLSFNLLYLLLNSKKKLLMIKHDGEISLSLRSKLYQLNLKKNNNFGNKFLHKKIGKVIEIYNFCDYDYNYFFLKLRLR